MIRGVQMMISCLFPIVGIVCVLFPAYVTICLPYLLGGAMALAGLAHCVFYFRDKRYLAANSTELARGLILLIMGSAFILQGPSSLGPMGTTWAIIGIRKASKSLAKAVQKIHQREHFAAALLLFFIRITLAMLLLFDPFEKFSTHIVILGLELIAVSVRFTAQAPPGWND